MEPSYNDSFRSNPESNSGRDSDVVNSAQVGAGSNQIKAGSVPVSSVLPDSAPVNSASANPTPIKSVPVNSAPVDPVPMNPVPVNSASASPMQTQASPGGTTFDSFQNPTMGGGFDFGSGFRQADTGMPIGSGTGDIVLNNAPKKKVNKRIIIVIIFAIVLALSLLLFVIFGRGQGGVGANVQNSFNRYANYFLYGENKTDKIEGAFNEDNEPYFEKALEELSGDERTTYLTNLKNYYGEFYNLMLEAKKEDESTTQWLEEYNAKFNIVANYYSGAVVNRSDVLNAYVLGGDGAVGDLIEERLGVYRDLPEVFETNYYDTASNLARAEMDYVIEYEEAGCLKDGRIDYNCAAERDVEGNNVELVTAISEDYWTLQATLNNCEYSVYSGIYGLRSLVYGEENSEVEVIEEENIENE